MKFKTTPLFGGAIVVDLPEGFQDVSEIRQIPDTQEVYLDSSGYTSIVFDILERVTTETPSDLAALEFHLSDITDSDAEGGGGGENTIILETGKPTTLTKLPHVKSYNLLTKVPPGEKQKGRPHEPEYVLLWVLLVRLEEVETDLVVSINVPCGIDDDGSVQDKQGLGREVRERVEASLEIKDWGLFGGGQ